MSGSLGILSGPRVDAREQRFLGQQAQQCSEMLGVWRSLDLRLVPLGDSLWDRVLLHLSLHPPQQEFEGKHFPFPYKLLGLKSKKKEMLSILYSIEQQSRPDIFPKDGMILEIALQLATQSHPNL